MPVEFGLFITTNQSPGVLLVSKKLPLKAVINELILIWSISDANEWINQIAEIPL